MVRLLFFFFVSAIFIWGFPFLCMAEAMQGKLPVVASLFPTYDFVRQIGGEHVSVTLLLPAGVESHSYSPTPRDMVTISKAKVFVYTGANMEPWAAGIIAGVGNENMVVVDTSKGVSASGHDGDHHDHNHTGTVDPHIWLDPIKAKVMVEIIGRALASVDPQNKDFYNERTSSYIEKLSLLDQKIRQSFSDCRINTIISGGHFAFGNFAQRYGIHSVSAYKGFSPDARPSPRAIATLIKTMQKIDSKIVFHEELIDPKVARIVAEETDAELRLLHGAHNITQQEMQKGITYLSIMESNLVNLQEAMQCQ